MRLPASLRAAFYATGALLFASGMAWLGLHYEAPERTAAAALTLEVHGGAAMAVLFVAGGVLALHAPSAWRERKNRASGALLAAALALLTASAFLLYYAGGDALREQASLVHWAIGAAAPLLVWLHLALGRRTR